MSKPDLQRVKQALLDAGLEIYRARETEIQLAERVRLHLMDSGVRVYVEDALRVRFTARTQRSDFPSMSADDLFDKVRGRIGSQANPRGYVEADAATIEVKDPVDENRILDVWHEVTYEKPAPDEGSVIDEVRWALGIEKYVGG